VGLLGVAAIVLGAAFVLRGRATSKPVIPGGHLPLAPGPITLGDALSPYDPTVTQPVAAEGLTLGGRLDAIETGTPTEPMRLPKVDTFRRSGGLF